MPTLGSEKMTRNLDKPRNKPYQASEGGVVYIPLIAERH